MEFIFNPAKTTEAASQFLSLNGGSMKYMGLIKLMYMSDRRALDLLDAPITGDIAVSMNRGPVLSRVLDFINHGQDDSMDNPWFQYISAPENYSIRLLAMPEFGELSKAEKDIINEVYHEYGKLDCFYLAHLTHEIFPEWKNPYGSAIEIKPEEILTALGKSAERIEIIRRQLEEQKYLDLLLS